LGGNKLPCSNSLGRKKITMQLLTGEGTNYHAVTHWGGNKLPCSYSLGREHITMKPVTGEGKHYHAASQSGGNKVPCSESLGEATNDNAFSSMGREQITM